MEAKHHVPRCLKVLVACLCAAGCFSHKVRSPNFEPTLPLPVERDPDLTPVNSAVDPCVDFASYACGDGDAPLGRLQSYAQGVRYRVPALRRLLDGLITEDLSDANPSRAMLREFYGRCIRRDARADGLKELREHIERVGNAQTMAQLASTLGVFSSLRMHILLSIYPYADGNEANSPVVARLTLTGPLLPGKHYAQRDRTLEALRAHWQRLASLTGAVTKQEIDAAVRIDSWLAEAHADPSELEPPGSVPTTRAGLVRARFPWEAYLGGAGLSPTAPVQAASANLVDRIDGLVQLPLSTLKSYVRVMLLERAAEYLDEVILQEEIRFHSGVVKGEKPQPFRLSSACFDLTNRYMDDRLAAAYLPSMVSPDGQEAARRMFALIRSRFVDLVASASWLDPDSRRAALAKVNAMNVRFIGDLEPLDSIVFQPGSLLAARHQIWGQITRQELGAVGHPRTGPYLSPIWYPAAYSNFTNEIWVSPEFARPPYVKTKDLDPVSFGAMGTLLGYHVADALGIVGGQWDTAGRRRQWCSNQTINEFDQRVACFRRQLGDSARPFIFRGGYHVDPVNGFANDVVAIKLSLGSMEAANRSEDRADWQQRRRTLFLAFAQQYCGWAGANARQQIVQFMPPARVQINRTLSNVPEFSQTFGCQPGKAMASQQRCSLW